MTSLQMTRPAPNIAWTDTYHNGGVEGRPLAEWYNSEFAAHFDAMDFTADLPDPAPQPEAPEQAARVAPAVDICARCQLCANGSLFPEGSGPAPVPGKTYSCTLLRWTREGVVDTAFAAQVVEDALRLQDRAIDGFVAAMPEHFGALRPATALDAEEHYVQGRALGVEIVKPVRDVAWFHFDSFRNFIRQNFESGFLRD
ncbi:hypothetical protein [Roseibaca sp. Y0-43]|uniref:hypothetical protein n=1 Tax=Roseibaca sp. Y0-43 TaxID=2816854 RepID=UPI001D0C094A|nr:hypothetical protein [Roseibaca sp. Y0-43]MCC1480863.1 hypothetical protein [Roseibaca sp. Y0-43]